MPVAMGAGLQARACCPRCCSFSSSSPPPASSSSPSSSLLSASLPSSSCLAPSRLTLRVDHTNNQPSRSSSFRLTTLRLICSASPRCRSSGPLDCGSGTRSRWRKLNGSAVAALLLSPDAGLISNHTEKRLRSMQLQVLPNSLAERSAELGDGQEESVEEDADLASITEWELDFCSRPILDPRGKKIWELVVCDSQRQLRFARFYPNNIINSGTLRDALAYIIETLRVPRPQKIRFFRSQTQTIIGKACAELDIQPVASQRCIQLVRWLGERFETVYRQHPGYQVGVGPLTLLEQPLPVEVPDTLRGDQWAFVQLPLSGLGFSALLDEITAVESGDNFGSILDLETLGLDLPPDAMIPGVAVASARAVPLAAWTNALELASIDIETTRSCLILSSGVADQWRYAYWRRGEQGDQEARAWEKAKRRVGGLHFLAVQQSLESEVCAGFWLLMNPPKPPV